MNWRTLYYPFDEYPANPAQCPTEGCSVEAPDPSDERDLSAALSSMGVADCPDHGRWYFMPSPETIDMQRRSKTHEMLNNTEIQ